MRRIEEELLDHNTSTCEGARYQTLERIRPKQNLQTHEVQEYGLDILVHFDKECTRKGQQARATSLQADLSC